MQRRWLIRLRGNTSQQLIAQQCGISQNFYSWIEQGERRPSVEVAKKIAAVLGFEWTRFFEEEDDEDPQSA
ncbi:MAG: helix-turn-helix transcriptional regulator [Firmicutes bacterium]|nr:helix-turn-helix transcriptional regulator [Bacillota bacterium]